MRIKISAGAERDIADGCDFYDDIDPTGDFVIPSVRGL